MLDAALADAWPGHGLSAAVPIDGWACSRGSPRSGSSLEVRLSGGGIAECLEQLLSPFAGESRT
ncbi:hypothetical protein SAMN04487849_11630 [Micrococcus luteus]|uniref:Uncharacterized protein n=1 Tax=Micrococcus luteus TaxID=1270 RepID=A0ABD7MA95_MICLU|nr:MULTISPECIES: hypothetical protein [Micrococcus]MBF0744066.1 hypothetical protein [Micrococcus yunnanensis]TFU56047.1 hypothetical protein E4T95_01145 [Micrococcus yunnanensis]SHL86953.1 hypothetical protein SAMN04487849_11630 [Micrococcus luteus]STY73571.1 Uncharacterised protein [Micrococcus luteus]